MMATFQKSSSMSDDSAYRLAKMLFGLDRGEFDIVLNKLNERYFEPIAQFAKRLSETRSFLLEAIARESCAFVQKIEAAPAIPSYEKLLIEKARYGPFLARLMAHQICHWGENLAAQLNEGRKVRAIIDKMADSGGRSALVMSRRAKNFRDDSSYAIGLGQRRLQPAVRIQAAQEEFFASGSSFVRLSEGHAPRRCGASAIEDSGNFWPILHFRRFARFAACLFRLNS
jgi:hypothetical protein